ncbi:MAG TPA: DUF459 domain-containing protein [Thermopetrobacter sp.]|nr:DUF459 domain-containing protein [Thermopetrobacter sp.]
MANTTTGTTCSTGTRRLLMAVVALLLLAAPGGAAVAGYIPQAQERYRVMVFGDRMATGLLAGLWRVLKGDERFEARGRLREGTGLARPRLLDWVRTVASTLDSRPVDIGIVMLGANDARDIVEGERRLAFGTERWRAAYAARWDALIAQFRSRKVALYIVGLPPVRDPQLDAALRQVSAVIRDRARAAGVRYIDIRGEFSDENGHYTDSGFDVSGTFRRLRARNGIQFIRPGNTKLASLVADVMLKDVAAVEKGGDAKTPPVDAEMAERPLVGRETPQGGAYVVPADMLPEENATVLAVTDGGKRFSQARAARAVAPGSAAASLLNEGKWPKPRASRSDDFRLPVESLVARDR